MTRRGLLLVLALFSCGPKKPVATAAKPDLTNAVARVGDTVITAEDLQRQLAAQPPQLRDRWSTASGKKDFLENLVRQTLLANEARARGLDRHPDVERVTRQQMISLYIQQELDAEGKAPVASDADVEKYYKEHANEFNRPEEVRVTEILVKDRAKATKAAAAAKALGPGDQKGFVDLVIQHSEDQASRTRGGDLFYFDRATTRVPRPVVEAAFALKETGQVAGPIKSDVGFHVIRLVERRPAVSRQLADARTEIQRRLHLTSRSRRMEELVNGLRAKNGVEIFPARLASVSLGGDAGR